MEHIKTFFRMYHQLGAILNKKEKKKALFIAIMSVVSALLETLGVSVMLPFILALLQPETLLKYEKIAFVTRLFNITTNEGIVALVAGGVIFIYIFKNIFLLAFGRYKNVFTNNLERDLSTMMFNTYIAKPYSFFLSTNTAQIERGVTSDVTGVSDSVNSYCNIVNEILTCGMLGVVLLIINPMMAVCIGVLAGGITLLMIQILRKRISNLGEEAREAFISRGKTIIETVSGIKEIKVMKRQDRFAGRFRGFASRAAELNADYLTLSMYPSRITEMIFITGLVLMVLGSYFWSDNVTVLMAQFSALAVAAIRILPSISNISNAVNHLVFQRPCLENAYNTIALGKIREEYDEDMLLSGNYNTYDGKSVVNSEVSPVANASGNEVPATNIADSEEKDRSTANIADSEEKDRITANIADSEEKDKSTANTAGTADDKKASDSNDFIRVNDISFKYSPELPYVVDGLSLGINRGEAVGFIGESGAGKTTLADIMLGLFHPEKGSITVEGKDIFDPATAWHKMIGYVPQGIFLLDDTVKNNILFGVSEEECDEERLNKAIDQAQMRSFIDRLPEGLDTIMGERGVKISGGQRQRIAIARALYYNPEILVLDEATSALDNETEAAVIEAVNALQGEKTLIIIAHRLSTIANCDKVYKIENHVAKLQKSR